MAKHTHPPKTIAGTTEAAQLGSPLSQRTTASGKSMTVVMPGNL
ncbi:hypothetical protein [Massilia pseudoviolaceinigra]|nr:hypothetical protein [Massilia sp. CCM 9206]MDQ1922476.1 hypothetical protein [Massilia sp. CCM 9206]